MANIASRPILNVPKGHGRILYSDIGDRRMNQRIAHRVVVAWALDETGSRMSSREQSLEGSLVGWRHGIDWNAVEVVECRARSHIPHCERTLWRLRNVGYCELVGGWCTDSTLAMS